jgi:hypothetical protein
MTTRVIEVLSMGGRDSSAYGQLVKREFLPIDRLRIVEEPRYGSAYRNHGRAFNTIRLPKHWPPKSSKSNIYDGLLCGAKLIDSPPQRPPGWINYSATKDQFSPK